MAKLLSLFLLSVFLVGASTEGNTTETCPIPFNLIGGRCLFLDPLEDGDWHLVRGFCNMVHGDLVKLDDANFMADLIDYIYEHDLDSVNYWIGASDEALEGDWRWLDGSSVRMGTPFWGYQAQEPITQEPANGTAENCACILTAYLFYIHDCRCTDSHAPICEYNEV